MKVLNNLSLIFSSSTLKGFETKTFKKKSLGNYIIDDLFNFVYLDGYNKDEVSIRKFNNKIGILSVVESNINIDDSFSDFCIKDKYFYAIAETDSSYNSARPKIKRLLQNIINR